MTSTNERFTIQPTPSYIDQAHLKSQKPIMFLSITLIIIALAGMVFSVTGKTYVSTASLSSSRHALAQDTALIAITSSGFNPATITVSRGQTVTWLNEDSALHQPASDPYPAANGLAGFIDATPLSQTATYGFTFDTVGTFTYHDQLNPFLYKGEVIVKP